MGDVDAHRRTLRADFLDTVKLTGLPPGENPDGFTVRVRDLPPRRVAYLRVMRPYEGDGVVGAAGRLVAWASLAGRRCGGAA